MRQARVLVHGVFAGVLSEHGREYQFAYASDYAGPPVSLTMPRSAQVFVFAGFPPFFDGLLPEGVQLESLLRSAKLDADDYFGQLVAVGADLVGAVTVELLA